MEDQDWVWVCTCGDVIPGGPEGHERETAQAHAAQHRPELPETGGRKFGPLPTTLIPISDFPSPAVCRLQWTNLRTGEVSSHAMVTVPNPAYEAFIWHGAPPYQIVPQHPDEPVLPVARVDRVSQDVDEAVALIEQCQPPLPDEDLDQVRQRLWRSVNLLCSAERDVTLLRDELFISHAARDAEVLRQRQHLPFEPQPMFRWGTTGRYFNGRSYAGQERAFRGPLTIQELLAEYAEALNEVAHHVAMAVLAEDAAMRNRLDASGAETEYQQHLFGATMFTIEPEAENLQTVRSLIAPEAEPQTP